MNVLLSLKPKYAEAILDGRKKYEFRRTIFKRKDISKIFIYSNNGVGQITGYFEFSCLRHMGGVKHDYLYIQKFRFHRSS
jgi:predicted transcriptional regulator